MMNDEFTVYEISLIDNSNYWIDESTYKDIKAWMETVTEPFAVLEFDNIDGMTVVTFAKNLVVLDRTTRAQRVSGRERNKEYRAAEVEPNEKEDWEK